MTRAKKREIKGKLNKEIADFLKIQKHYFPDLIQDIKTVMDGRHQSYNTNEIRKDNLISSDTGSKNSAGR